MHYEINVAINGSHYFATNERSIHTEDMAHQLANELEEFFSLKYDGVAVEIQRVVKSYTTIKRKIKPPH